MGYVLFASRKIALTNQINTLQIRLDDIMNQKQRLLNYSANIADGYATIDDFVSDFTNAYNYNGFNNGKAEYIAKCKTADTVATALSTYRENDSNYSTNVLAKIDTQYPDYDTMTDDEKQIAIDTLEADWNASDPDAYAKWQRDFEAYKKSLTNNLENSLSTEYYQNVESKKIAAEENRLEMQQKKIESQISALQADLSSCEQAEAKGIQNATPKYAGLG